MKIFSHICLFLLLSFRGFSQGCTLSVTITQSAPTICSGNSVVLTAATSGGTAPFIYVWSTGETTPSISVNKQGTYTVSVSDKTPGCKAVIQSLTIAASSVPNAPTVSSVIVCPNSSATFTAVAPGGTYQWYDAATGGNFLGTGDTYSTPPITASTPFYVETTESGCTSQRSAVYAVLSETPTGTGASICAGNTATLSISKCDSYTWYDAPSAGNIVSTSQTFTTPLLNATKTYYVVTVNNGCVSGPIPVTAYVIPSPQPPVASNLSICFGGSANLHASGNGTVFNWYNVPTGGIPLISSPDYTTPPLTATTVYYVEGATNTCVSPRTMVTVTVNTIPAAPTVQSDTICNGTSAILQATTNPTGTYEWYDEAVNGRLLSTGVTYNTPVLNNSTTYYVLNRNGGCASSLTPVNVIVRPALYIPSISGSIICSGSATTLTVASQGGSYEWYDSATGGNLLATGTSFTTPSLTTNTTYYVQNVFSGCTSARAAVTVSMLSSITPPLASDKAICYGSSAVLIASGSIGSYAWYDSASGGNLLSSAQVYITPSLTATTTYFVETAINGCTSVRTPVTVTVRPASLTILVSSAAVCPGTSVSLTAQTSGTIEWYDAAAGGNLLASGKTFNTPPLMASTTYYAQNGAGQCTCSRTPVTIFVNSVANPLFQYPSGTFCVSGANPSPVINDPSGGVFSAAPAGLVFINASTGQINLSASTPGKYIITFTGNNVCRIAASANLAIVSVTNSSFSYNGPFCRDGINPLPNFTGTGTAGNFSAAPAGLLFVNTSTGEIDLAKSNPGTYTITNSISASGGCPASITKRTVTITQGITVNAGPPQTVQKGNKVQLAGTISGAASAGTWSGGTGSFSNPSDPNAVYTPGTGESTATLILTSNGTCGPKSDSVTITINSLSFAPVAPNVAVCVGSSATLLAIAPGGIYQWYDSAMGGTLLSTGPIFTTPPLMVNTTYYVQTSICSGLTSNRTAVTAGVTPMPAPPIAPGAQICEGSVVTLTASGSPGGYQWYDAPAGGNLVSLNNTYVTPVLTANTTYYVQANVNGCTSTLTPVNVTVIPVAAITSSPIASICSDNQLNYNITANLPTATFSWSRAQVAGISNPAVTGQTAATINETLINTSGAAINVTYVIVPVAGSCAGPAFNFVVTVYPAPVVTGAASTSVCNYSSGNYAIAFNTPGTSFNWSRPAVQGLSNAAVSGQTSGIINEVLFNTTNTPVDVPYTINYNTSTCPGVPFNILITVNPYAVVTSSASGTECSGLPQQYIITSNVPSATFVWSRDSVSHISNPAVFNQTSGTINEALINTAIYPVDVIYTIIPMAYGCPGKPFTYIVTVNPQVATPVANSNSPVCVGTTIHLATPVVPNASYSWTGPNGYASSLQNPDITNASAANAGVYTLVVTLNGCASPPSNIDVVVNEPPLSAAGSNQLVCISAPSIPLAGSVTGGTTTGIWTTSGTGTFSPSINALNGWYIPSNSDRAAGSVILTLSSTSKDNCNISTSNMTITFGRSKAVIVGENQVVCSQVTSVKLSGNVLITGGGKWSTSGNGAFNSSDTQLNADYIPGAADVKKGSVTLTLLAIAADSCYIATDSMTIKFIPPPIVNVSGIAYVLRGNTITLKPVVSEDSVQYLWSPDIDINNVNAKNPIITGDIDRTYTLTVTDSRGCITQNDVIIKVSPKISVDNTFTPNGDGINDVWNITGLVAYENATVDIFNRYGQKVFHSLGYPKAWDGTYNGLALPVGVYYYIIDTKVNSQVLSGSVTILR